MLPGRTQEHPKVKRVNPGKEHPQCAQERIPAAPSLRWINFSGCYSLLIPGDNRSCGAAFQTRRDVQQFN